MQRIAVLLVALLFAVGCGKDNKAVEPDKVPEKPKDNPNSSKKDAGTGPVVKPNSAQPLTP